ncbi:putative disease resistance protein At3g14460 [Vigna unguiculata]|uniref:putative disease resistance protein At3g14460 n=1 Tax=Vigna unguiculata TaxID=3917 RepID=UPI0010165F10|nr:putative disease resistance protein At3g14460 [Vigna unguiculata]
MALELVGGALLSVFLDVAFNKLASSQILDFFRARKLDEKLLNNLKTKLNSIHSLADDAERKQFTDPHVRNWLLEVKDAVLDAEDLLDDIQMLSKRQADADSESQTSACCTFKVLNFFKSSPITSYNKEIESRMQEVLDKLEFLSSQRGDLGLKTARAVRSGLSSELPQKSQTTSLVVGTDIYGRDDDKKHIVDWLISDTNNSNQPSILSIVGMGGLGKTTLAQHVFNDPRINEAKFDVKVWVCVSDEFDVFKVSRAILEAVTKSTDDSRDLEMVHTRLKENLTKKKFLLVLDDVWNENQHNWEEVQKPLMFGVQGSRILVTARSKEVASTMRSEVHSLKQLQEDDCWNLFVKYAFKDIDTQQNPECTEIGKKIVEKCKGLPLALKTMGSLLYNKSSVSEWESVFQSEIWEFSQDRCDIIPALAMSYIHLPSHLKVCFAYCALFPKDYEFKKEHLMHLWMTENLLHCPSEKVCQQYFNDLLSRSFFQQSGKNEVFVMHDLLNDLAKYVGGGIYFRWEVGQKEKIQKATRHYSIKLGHNQYFDGFETSCNTKRLRTFIPTGRRIHSLARWGVNMSMHEFFSKFRHLRILSLSYCSKIRELPDSIANLEYLRSLDLSHTSIRILTEKICSLSHLQILKLNYCSDLEELPSNLHLLTNLCLLELMENIVKKLPPSLGKLKNLKVVMRSFHVGHGREFGIQQLGELNLDGSLSIMELQNIENSLDASEAYLKNKTLLVRLELRWEWNRDSIDSKKEEEVIKNLQPSENLKELEILFYGGKQFPNWLHSLPNLVALELFGCESCEHLPPLGLLPFLKDLSIDRLDGIVSIDADFYGSNSSSFKSLQSLEFSNMEQWKKWECKAGVFPRLQYLSIISCPKLKGELPEQLVPLNKIHIRDCQQLEASAPRALDLKLYDCGKLHLDWATMKSLLMEASLTEIVRSDTVKYLKITLETISDDCVSLRIFPLDFFPTLCNLYLSGFPNLQTISQDHIHHHLEHMTIKECPKFELLPANMHTLLPSLNALNIEDCPKLESFLKGVLPSNLKFMRLKSCSRLLVDSLKGAFRDNPSLERLSIEKVDAKCFPDEGLLPLSLTQLSISNSPNLEKLDYKGLYQLSSLQSLRLDNCPNLQCLPEEGLPKSISHLHIGRCPLLEQRCQKERGEDWEKISHIQDLYIH